MASLVKQARITGPRLHEVCTSLASDCPHLRAAFERTGLPPLRRAPPGYATLVRLICEQSISIVAALAILRRLEIASGGITAENIAALSTAQIKAVGLTAAKAACIRELAVAVLDARLDTRKLGRMSDEDVVSTLIAFKGVGRWTAEVYLLFALMRPDIWPVGDVAIVIAAQRLFDLPERPGRRELLDLGERWRPWRSVAARILWKYYHITSDE